MTVGRIWSCGSPVIGHTHLQTREGTSPIVEELFGQLYVMEKKEEEEQERKKETKMNKTNIFMFIFVNFEKH